MVEVWTGDLMVEVWAGVLMVEVLGTYMTSLYAETLGAPTRSPTPSSSRH